MKIATYNVNGINGRLPRLLEWLDETQPDVACLQEIKTSDETFPIEAIHDGRLRRDLVGAEVVQRRRDPRARRDARRAPARAARRRRRHAQPLHRGRGRRRGRRLALPAQRQPAAGPEVRLQARLVRALQPSTPRRLLEGEAPGGAGRRLQRRARPTSTSTTRAPGSNDALLQPESRAAYAALLKQGWTDAIRAKHPDERIYTFWDYLRNRWPRNAGLRIDHLLLSPDLRRRTSSTPTSTASSAARKRRATTRRPGWCWADDARPVRRRRARARGRAPRPRARSCCAASRRAREAALKDDVARVAAAAPFRHLVTPGGFRMSVAMTNCGELGWVSDRRGYRYDPVDPESGRALARAARRRSARSRATPLHAPVMTASCRTPAWSIATRRARGCRCTRIATRRTCARPSCRCRWACRPCSCGAATRAPTRPRRVPLHHGDVVVWGGPSRLRFHGVLALKDGEHPFAGGHRINLTFRKVRP